MSEHSSRLLCGASQGLANVCLFSLFPHRLFHADLPTLPIPQTCVSMGLPEEDGYLCMLYFAVFSWPLSCLGLFAYGKFFLSVLFSMT